ncbi:MAG: hypothetical protein AAB646_01840 [Patescibacteria group bacterium]
MVKSSVKDRIRVTKNGKLLRRKMGLGHFRAKKNGTVMHRKEQISWLSKPDHKTFTKKYGI